MNKFIILFCLILSACSSSNTRTSYYSINSNHQTSESICKNCNTVIVKINTPDFLNQKSIGYYSDNQLILSKNNLWTNDLNEMLQDNLSDMINISKENKVIAFSQLSKPSGIEIKSELKINIYSFNGIADGFVEVSGKYFYTNADNSIKQGTFSIKTKQENDGFYSLVNALNKTWIKICNNMIKDLF